MSTEFPITDSPSGISNRGQFGASEQPSSVVGPDGLRTCVPAIEDAPTRGGEACQASPFRLLGEVTEDLTRSLERHLRNRAIDEAEIAQAKAAGVRSYRRTG